MAQSPLQKAISKIEKYLNSKTTAIISLKEILYLIKLGEQEMETLKKKK